MTLQSTLDTARRDAGTLKVNYDTKVTRFELDNSNLQSALDAQKEALARANQTISDLESTLKAARVDAETLKADYDMKLSRFQRDNASLQSAFDTLNKKVAEGELKLSPSIGDFKKWMRETSVNVETLISDPDPSAGSCSSNIHHELAYNALMELRSEKWNSAYEDAKKVNFHTLIGVFMSTYPFVKSILTRPSTMGYISKVLAQIGKGESEKAMQVFDLAFANCNPNESNLLLLIKVRDTHGWYVVDTDKRQCYLDHHLICGREM